MAEERYRVNVYEIDFKCDVCGKGWYRPTGDVFPTYPMKFPHKCNGCGAEMVVIGRAYPYTIMEKVNENGVGTIQSFSKMFKNIGECYAEGFRAAIDEAEKENGNE